MRSGGPWQQEASWLTLEQPERDQDAAMAHPQQRRDSSLSRAARRRFVLASSPQKLTSFLFLQPQQNKQILWFCVLAKSVTRGSASSSVLHLSEVLYFSQIRYLFISGRIFFPWRKWAWDVRRERDQREEKPTDFPQRAFVHRSVFSAQGSHRNPAAEFRKVSILTDHLFKIANAWV